jgi:hypothetical protein
VKPHAYGDPATNVFVTVSGPLGYSVFPFFGLHLTAEQVDDDFCR